MAINRFGIATDGIDKPETHDLSGGKYKALLVTDGYFNSVAQGATGCSLIFTLLWRLFK